ncbi:MAG: potassium transporter Kup [Alphaproteobacteria bacterium]|jgi:KUP system potassium uptake protein|uniref:potassium transporter Kup n=1 Tax=Devosia sp. XGJD_8 TaxID=3391187 RepID=UPI001D88EFB7|nr:potassium transporter Kup [Alphaproteobacteria bacterium]MBU1559849.1 potassium transporter Kup [Alphaproteobacteria bacterium]MBU2300998.1 potassium transporter Kup [Alphaproteobacteria bacterium]MBU2368814.1 potassium transporter Kup [Alphaproteobacteria bacterium]
MTQTNPAGASPAGVDASDHTSHSHSAKDLPLLIMGAIGVVYGDIGTSPIYAFRQAMQVRPGAAATSSEVLGLLSLIVWALTLTVAVKYVFFVTRADNNGEGGTLSLMALARKTFTNPPIWITVLGVIGAAMFFGDAIITPAISVLSAVEGVQLVTPGMARWVVPITLVIILGIFFVQRFGTAKVSIVFGPITAIWFLVLGFSGLVHIIDYPAVLWALNPYLGIEFLVTHFGIAFVVVGAIFLAVTGAEALYVDLGHFGRKPIVLAWFGLVFPCLLLNYFGQGAFVLEVGVHNVQSPFFEMQPEWALLPFVGLATMATIIASQAVISGTYSLTQQAIALNMLPRMVVEHTSETQSGQVYMPQINTMLMLGVLVLVVSFGSSEALSNAYGIAVSGVMIVTLSLLVVVMWRNWKWHPAAVIAFGLMFLLIDGGFFAANVAKLFQGGWVPAAVALVVSLIMWSWMAGRRRLAEKTRRDEVPLQFLVDNLAKKKPMLVPGTAVFLTSDIEGAPTALLHSLKHYKVLHEQNVILTVRTSASPRVPDDEKVTIDAYNELFSRVVVTFGYMESPNIPKALVLARKLGWKFDIMSTSFFLSRRSLKPGPKAGSPLRYWQDRLFTRLAKNASDATEYFHIPTGRVVEIGTQVVL